LLGPAQKPFFSRRSGYCKNTAFAKVAILRPTSPKTWFSGLFGPKNWVFRAVWAKKCNFSSCFKAKVEVNTVFLQFLAQTEAKNDVFVWETRKTQKNPHI
jgi:hypothetical protein